MVADTLDMMYALCTLTLATESVDHLHSFVMSSYEKHWQKAVSFRQK